MEVQGISNIINVVRYWTSSSADELTDNDEEIIEAIPEIDSQTAFEDALDKLAPKLIEYTDRLAATYYPTTTYWNWVKHWLARFLYAISRPIIAWRVNVGIERIKQAIEQTSDEEIETLVREVTLSIREYVKDYNTASQEWAQKTIDGDDPEKRTEFIPKYLEERLTKLPNTNNLRQLCREATDLAHQIVVPWGFRTVSAWWIPTDFLYDKITSCRNSTIRKQENGIVHGIHNQLTTVLDQALENLSKPVKQVDLSQRELTHEVDEDVAKNVQNLLPDFIKMLRNAQKCRDYNDEELPHALINPSTEEKEIDGIINLEGLLEDPATRTWITGLIIGQPTGADLYRSTTLLVNNIDSVISGEQWPSKKLSKDSCKEKLSSLAQAIHERYVLKLGGIKTAPNVTAEIDAGAADCNELVAQVEKYIANAPLFLRLQIRSVLAKIDEDRTKPGAHQEYDDETWDDNAYFSYFEAARDIQKLPPNTPLEETLQELSKRLIEARDVKDKEVTQERLQIQSNEVQIGKLVEACKVQLNAIEPLYATAQLRAKLERAKRAITWLKQSDVAARQKSWMTENGQKVFNENLKRIAETHLALEQQLNESDQIQDSYQKAGGGQQLADEAHTLLKKMRSTVEQAQWNDEGLKLRSRYSWTTKANLVWRLDEVEKYYVTNPLNGVMTLVERPSLLEAVARMALKVGVQVLKKGKYA